MRHLNLWLDKYSQRRDQILDNWTNLTQTLLELKTKIPHDDLFKDIETTDKKNPSMCFVDGGQGYRELLGLGIYLIRASGLILDETTENRELFLRDLDMNILHYDEHTKERLELLRDGMEYDIALKSAKEYHPKLIFLDGSLHVKAHRKPLPLLEYDLYRKKYARLLKQCKKDNIHLIGVSEDSKSRLLTHHLNEEYGIKMPKYMTDSTMLKILSDGRGYRTIEFTPKIRSPQADTEPENITQKFKTAYLQTNEISNPLRIDVPEWETDFNHILAIIASLCAGSGYYGYPLPLYIAHMDAHIPPNQMEWTTQQLVKYISNKNPLLAKAVLKNTRRQERPNT